MLRVSVVGGKIEKKASIEDLLLQTLFETREEKDQGLTFVAAFRNEGNIHVIADGRLIILTPDLARKGEVAFNVGTGTVLPGRTRDFVAVYDRLLAEGSYIARAAFKYGGTSGLEKEIPFTVSAKASDEQEDRQNNAAVPVIKIIPAEVRLKVPAGGFRTIGVELRNQSREEIRVRLKADPDSEVSRWFKIEPEELLMPGGRAAKILIRCTVPGNSRPQIVKTAINADPDRIDPKGNVEPLGQQTIGIDLEIPKL